MPIVDIKVFRIFRFVCLSCVTLLLTVIYGGTEVGYTSAPGEGGIVNSKEYERRFSPHVLDWLVFAFMTLPSLGIPFLLWFSSKSKYDVPKPKRN